MVKHELLYASIFCAHSREVAKAELLIKRSEYTSEAFEIPFRLGVRIGFCLLLLSWVAWDIIADYAFIQKDNQEEQFLECHKSNIDRKMSDSIIDTWFKKDFPLYRGMMSLVLALWMWGGLIYTWQSYRINYLFMLELDPKLTPSMIETLWTAADLTILVLASFIIHFKVLRCQFPRWPNRGSLGIWPLIPFTYMVFKAVFPWSERKQIWRVAWAVVVAPCVEVSFCMNFVGDVLTSLVKPLVDVAYTVCFYTSGDWLQHLGEDGVCMDASGVFVKVISPIILISPYWFRLMQCLRRYADSGKRHPNLPNAFKYGLSMCVTIFGIFDDSVSSSWNMYRAFWIATYFSSTLYSWSWDVLMDWSAFKISEPFRLRSRQMLPNSSYYYFAIVADLILRYFWTYTLIPVNDNIHFEAYLGLYIAPFAAIAEIIRRTMWSVFRLENEHLHNTAGYRKVKHIPLHFDTPLTQSIQADTPKTHWHIAVEASLFVAVVITVLVVAITSN
jgi:xenotropic and polytropic retrovirus receptor 1